MSCLTNFNLDSRNGIGGMGGPKVNALAGSPLMQKLGQPLRLPKVRPLTGGRGAVSKRY